MIFYIKLKKLKKLNKEVSSSFTLLELVVVIILIGILAFSIPIFLPNNNLQLAVDNLVKNIYFTQSLALKDDKYQPFPNHKCDGSDEGKVECNRSKYWFKQWWQIRISKNKNAPTDLWYEVFSDVPFYNSYNFDRVGNYPPKSEVWEIGYAKNPLNGKYLTGKCDTDGKGNYPPCDKIDKHLNLTASYGIKEIIFNGTKISSSNSGRILFDNFGNVFLNEGLKGDGGDINPLDSNNRELLVKTLTIKLCLDSPCIEDKNRCAQINITPTGFVYTSDCR